MFYALSLTAKNFFSAIESIRPWKDVFTSGTMQAFIGMNIIPKLEKALQTIDLNTTENFEYLEIFDWVDLVNVEIIAKILTTSFFPRVCILDYEL